jgi:hypothetical protein
LTVFFWSYRKVWAELPDPKEEDGKLVHTAVSLELIIEVKRNLNLTTLHIL